MASDVLESITKAVVRGVDLDVSTLCPCVTRSLVVKSMSGRAEIMEDGRLCSTAICAARMLRELDDDERLLSDSCATIVAP